MLRALGEGHKLGVAWYLYPDESHNEDGKHTDYLTKPEKWRYLDPALFDELEAIVHSNRRAVLHIEKSCLLNKTHFSSTPLAFNGDQQNKKSERAN